MESGTVLTSIWFCDRQGRIQLVTISHEEDHARLLLTCSPIIRVASHLNGYEKSPPMFPIPFVCHHAQE